MSTQPKSLFDLSLAATALSIRQQFDAILNRYRGNVYKPAFIKEFQEFNTKLIRDVPKIIIHRIKLLENLSMFIYFESTSIIIDKHFSKDEPVYQHFIQNIIPKLTQVTIMNVSMLQSSFELFEAISAHCKKLEVIYLEEIHWGSPCRRCDVIVPIVYSLLLSGCKKMRFINPYNPLDVVDRIVARPAKDFRDVKVFDHMAKCGGLTMTEMQTGIYRFKYIVMRQGYAPNKFREQIGIPWVIKHCPFITALDYEYSQINNTVFTALSKSNLRIKELRLPECSPKISEGLKKFIVKRGKYIVTLTCNFDPDFCTYPFSREDLELISRYCTTLHSLHLTFRSV